ncbi:uncharacterized protein LACBIDRAFT_316721 [Laccaria bicolor S238N-H82]|uniref:Predicted protein n=1 Tax=Laccaria bicolor (strain S238N-H82 / ATCC MYA-4686) TaxID=486041 RepID=B0E1H9_LACBS|nr:uncharacterized protein LACBIDRAFT_316721 [Laccaria bicolor S238N-H82]EDQ99331.1 predicted protein [Laccaria bicolor S238N-H82]|eukprot:XP_001890051.1 predicted protein [Laccaria bicolor S238N-H82]
MNLVHSVEKLVHHMGKIRWLSLDDDLSFLLSTGWCHRLGPQTPNTSGHYQLTQLNSSCLLDAASHGPVDEGLCMWNGRWRASHFLTPLNTFHDVLVLDDEEAKERIFNYLFYCDQQRLFESPVRSGFLMPRGVNSNRNRSAFSPEVKRPDWTAKRPQTAVFCGL